jgi:hypothetical protein
MVSDRSNGINWRKGVAAKLGLFIALAISASAIGWGWNYGLTQEFTYEQEARQAHAKYTKNGCNEIAKPKPQVASVKKAESEPCAPNEKAQEENDNRRDYADLVAQRSSALWAKIMGIAALIGMGLSFVGVALVWTTFRETRKANDIAAKFQRAVIVPKLNIVDSSERTYVCSVEAENVGASPAVDVHVFAIISEQMPQHHDDNSDFGGRWVVKPGKSQFLAAFHSIDGSEDGKFVFGSIRYKTLLGSTHYSHFCFRIMRSRIHPYISAPASRIGVESVPSNWPDNT